MKLQWELAINKTQGEFWIMWQLKAMINVIHIVKLQSIV